MKIPYYYPNRPRLIPPDPDNPLNPKPDYINSLELSGKYIGELKWNGDNCLIYTGPDPAQGPPQFWNRHGTRLKYVPSLEIQSGVSKLPPDCVLNAELVHNHTKAVKHTLIVHCVMVWKGLPLFGKSWAYSRQILEELSVWNNSLRLSEVFQSGFWNRFQSADGEIIEGIILKDPSGGLQFSTRPLPDVSWMLKIRKPNNKYNF